MTTHGIVRVADQELKAKWSTAYGGLTMAASALWRKLAQIDIRCEKCGKRLGPTDDVEVVHQEAYGAWLSIYCSVDCAMEDGWWADERIGSDLGLVEKCNCAIKALEDVWSILPQRGKRRSEEAAK